MKKVLFSIMAALLVVLGLSACSLLPSGEVTTTKKDATTANPNATNIGAITVWCAEKAVDLTKSQLDAYLAANAETVTFTYTVAAVGEGDAATQMITDVEAGADIFCFAQDQLARLVEAGALARLSDTMKEKIVAANDGGSVKAASLNDVLYAYPMTSDNGYFMYYDKSVVQAEHLDDLAAIVKDCEDAGKTINFKLGDAWYNASFFFATGCSSIWSTNEKGAYTHAVDNYNSANGIIALKGMQILTSSDSWVDAAETAAFQAAEGVQAAVVISGTWGATTAKESLGENYAATDLPSFTVGENTYHLGSFSGNKLMGVKPQTDGTRAAVLATVAQYLTGKDCQLQRFNSLSWGPSNLEAQQDEAIKADEALTAFALQNRYAVPQGQYPNAWWSIGNALGAVAQNAETDDDLQEGLNVYQAAVEEIIELQSATEKNYVLVGSWNEWNNKGEDADGNATEFKLSKNEDGTYSTMAYLPAGSFGRITEYGDWTSATGYEQTDTDLVEDYGNDNNFTVVAGGVYQISVMPTTGAITISQPNLVCVGAWCNWDNTSADYTLVASEDGRTYSITIEAAKDANGRIVFNGAWGEGFGYLLVDAENTLVVDDLGGDHNFKFVEAGT